MRLTLSGIFLILILWKPIYFSYRVLFAKCSAAHRLLDQRVKSGLRTKRRFLRLPVKRHLKQKRTSAAIIATKVPCAPSMTEGRQHSTMHPTRHVAIRQHCTPLRKMTTSRRSGTTEVAWSLSTHRMHPS